MGQVQAGGTSVDRASWLARVSWAENPVSMLYDSWTRWHLTYWQHFIEMLPNIHWSAAVSMFFASTVIKELKLQKRSRYSLVVYNLVIEVCQWQNKLCYSHIYFLLITIEVIRLELSLLWSFKIIVSAPVVHGSWKMLLVLEEMLLHSNSAATWWSPRSVASLSSAKQHWRIVSRAVPTFTHMWFYFYNHCTI